MTITVKITIQSEKAILDSVWEKMTEKQQQETLDELYFTIQAASNNLDEDKGSEIIESVETPRQGVVETVKQIHNTDDVSLKVIDKTVEQIVDMNE